MHYLSILLIIFTMFENLLSNLVKDLSYINKVNLSSNTQKELLKIITPKNNNKVTVSKEFLDMCFILFGDIASHLEKAYWDYKRSTFKIK